MSSIETISQVLSPTNATYINGVSAERLLAPAVLKNIFQGVVEVKGKGINDRFVTDAEALNASQIFVNRVLPAEINARVQGASKNGGSFSNNQHYSQTITVGIDILTIVDDPIILPRARQDTIKVSLLAENTAIFSDRLNTIINGATTAEKYLGAFTAANANITTLSAADITNKQVFTRYVEANSLLDEGDQANGIDIFPEEDRIAVFKPSFRPTLIGAGILGIGGANYGYDIARSGAVDATSVADKLGSGFIGVIDKVDVHVISNGSLIQAEKFLGLPYELRNGAWYGYISSGVGTARGVAMSDMFKIVDSPNGQGLICQPYVKLGVACWYPLSISMLVGDGYVNPFTALKSLFTSLNYTVKTKAYGSRLVPTITISAATTANVTATFTALDDNNVDHVLATACFVESTAPITSVGAFYTAYNAVGAIKGKLTSGVQGAAAGGTAGHYVNVLALADDGTATIVSKVIA